MRGLIQYVLKLKVNDGPEMGVILECTAESQEEGALLAMVVREHERQRQLVNSVLSLPPDSSDLLSTFEGGDDDPLLKRRH